MLRTSALVVGALLGLAPGSAAQVVPVLRSQGGAFELWLAPEDGGPATLAASGLSFLPLDLAGAVGRERFLADHPHPVSGAPAAHIALPDGGDLYLVSASGFSALLQLRADGSIRAPLALPEMGAPALQDRLAVAQDASRALALTPAAAGGQVWLADLTGAAPRLLSPPGAAPAEASSLRVSSARAAFVAGGVLHVADLSVAAAAAPVPLGAPGDVTLPELVLSADGLAVAALTQAPGGARQVHVVDRNGHASTITPTPGAYDTPHLQSPFGPWLALAPDGSELAFRGVVGASAELFVRPVPQPVAPVQVTADVNYIDTIDNVGVLGYALPGKLIFMAGELGGAFSLGALDAADAYTVTTLPGGTLALGNATQTSGDLAAPFTAPGDLELIDQALAPLGAKQVLVVDPQGGDAALMSMPADGAAPATMLLPGLAQEPELHAAGDSLLVISRSCDTCSRQLSLLGPSGALMTLGTLPNGVLLDRFVAGGGYAAFVASAGPGLQLAVRVQTATGGVDIPWPFAGSISPAIALDPASGALRLGVGGAGGPPLIFLQLDAPLSGAVLGVPVGDGLPLGG
jgi:hypothetical protein